MFYLPASSATASTGNDLNKILISACLLGEPVRYDGQSRLVDDEKLRQLMSQKRVISFCPEVSGGLPVPRPAAEITSGTGIDVIEKRAQVKTADHDDVTEYFVAGARRALEVCLRHDIQVAVLTESSPSCGSSQVYDGSFRRKLIPGDGVTSALLRQNGISVFSQHQLKQAFHYLESNGDDR